MASPLTRADSDRQHEGSEHTPRLRLKRKAPVTGYVDGAWWPHTGDLPNELPDLLTVLSVRLGSVERVSYRLDEWAHAPRKMRVGGQLVRLDGFNTQPRNTIGVSGRGHNIVLLVVPSRTEADRAHTIVMAAAAPGDASTVDSLLG